MQYTCQHSLAAALPQPPQPTCTKRLNLTSLCFPAAFTCNTRPATTNILAALLGHADRAQPQFYNQSSWTLTQCPASTCKTCTAETGHKCQETCPQCWAHPAMTYASMPGPQMLFVVGINFRLLIVHTSCSKCTHLDSSHIACSPICTWIRCFAAAVSWHLSITLYPGISSVHGYCA